MQVSVSGYYAWLQRKPSRRAQQNGRLLEQVRSTFEQSRATYGSPRVYQELKAQGLTCSENRIARLMRQNGIRVQSRKSFVITTQSDPTLPVAENVLARQFQSQTPNARWLGDITYLWTQEGWLYLAGLLDLFSRRVVGWAMGTRLDRRLVLSALDMALASRRPQAGLLCHSDQGSQYQSHDYQARLSAAGLQCSMSRKGNCWDNAPMESFFASLKRELIHRRNFATRKEAQTAVFEWIEVFYNRQRRHSALGYLSPEDFERQYLQRQQQKPDAA